MLCNLLFDYFQESRAINPTERGITPLELQKSFKDSWIKNGKL